MKKVIFTIAALLMCTSISFSQVESDKSNTNLRLGIKGGLNLANIGGNATGLSSRSSFHLGMFTELSVTKQFLLQPELVYSSQGAQRSAGNNPIQYNYLNLPVIMKFRTFESFHVDFGPQFGFLLNAKSEQPDGTVITLDDANNSFDLSLAAGFGYDYGDFNFNFRYNLGISNTSKNSDNGSFPNRVLQVSIGLRLIR